MPARASELCARVSCLFAGRSDEDETVSPHHVPKTRRSPNAGTSGVWPSDICGSTFLKMYDVGDAEGVEGGAGNAGARC